MPNPRRDISTTASDLRTRRQAIRGSSRLTTDRAHVRVAATLIGRRVHYLECGHWKVRALAHFTSASAFAHSLRPTDLNELVRGRKITRCSATGIVDRPPALGPTRGGL
jgi:hypothetical protein